MKANHWVMDMERIFKIVKCDDRQQIMCSCNTLKVEAHNWWMTVIKWGIPTTWEEFMEELRNTFHWLLMFKCPKIS